MASWAAILPAIGGYIVEVIKGRQRVSAAKADAVATQDTLRVKALAGLTDEMAYFTIGYPFLSLFVPPLRPHTVAAFEQIALLPDWYIGLFVTATCAALAVPVSGRIKGVMRG